MSTSKGIDDVLDMVNIFEISSLSKKINDGEIRGKIVYTYGAWDLLHPGHIKFLLRAKSLGDFLVVGTVSDKPIRDLKGINRPNQKQIDRMFSVASLRCVDAVINQPEYDPSEQLRTIKKIDILTKGDDWEHIPGTETVEKLGGKLVKLSYTKGFSTSSLVKQISDNAK